MGATKSKQNKKKAGRKPKTDLPDHIYDLLAKSLRSLPFPDGAITDDMVQKAANYAQFVNEEGTEIIKKGQRSKGLYMVIKGEAEVLTSDGEVIATLTSGSLCGEVSTLFYVPCTATVRVNTKATLLLIRAEKLRLALKDQVVSMSLSDYFVSRRYFDTNGIIKQPDLLSQRITKSVMREVPMFAAWGDPALDELIENLQHNNNDPVLLVPPKSFLVNEGDPGDEIIIIARGRVEVLKEKELICELDSSRWPICLGEEGLFTENKSNISVRSMSPCTAIIIKNTLIKEIAEKHKEDDASDYTDRIDRWSVRPGIDEDSPVRLKYGAEIKLPVLLKRLGDTPLLFEAPLGLVYDLAMECDIKERTDSKVILGKNVLARRKSSKLIRSESRVQSLYEKPINPSKHGVEIPAQPENDDSKDALRIPPEGDMTVAEAEAVFEDSDKFIVVLKGAMVLGENNDWTCNEGEMLWVPRKVLNKTKLTAQGDTLTLQLSGAAVLEACDKYQDTKLFIPSTLK